MPTDPRVALAVPALPEYLRVVRLTASGLASRLGFPLDDVDDLRLALDELCFAVIGKGVEGAELEIEYLLGDNSLVISGSVNGGHLSTGVTNELSAQILGALVDEHKVWSDDGVAHFSLLKKSSAA